MKTKCRTQDSGTNAPMPGTHNAYQADFASHGCIGVKGL